VLKLLCQPNYQDRCALAGLTDQNSPDGIGSDRPSEKRKVDSSILSLTTTTYGRVRSALTSTNAYLALSCPQPSGDRSCPCVTVVRHPLSHADRTPRASGGLFAPNLRPVCRISSSGQGRPDRFRLDQCPWSVCPGRRGTVWNCNLNCNQEDREVRWPLCAYCHSVDAFAWEVVGSVAAVVAAAAAIIALLPRPRRHKEIPAPAGQAAAVVPPADTGTDAPVMVGEIPREPLGFQPRTDLLAALDAPGPVSRVVVVHALTGLRGMGKTHLAAAYARAKLAERWPLVAWINAGDLGGILAGLAEVAAELGVSQPDAEGAARAVRRRLEIDGDRCLLVFEHTGDCAVAGELSAARPQLWPDQPRIWSSSRRGQGRDESSEDEGEGNPSLTGGVTRLWKAFVLLEGPHRRGRVRAIDPVDRTRVHGGREQQSLQAPDRVAGSTLKQVRAWSERESVVVDKVELAPRDGPSYSVRRPAAKVGLEGSQRGLRRWPEVAVYGTGTQDSSWEVY
jgi:hypothetical protein